MQSVTTVLGLLAGRVKTYAELRGNAQRRGTKSLRANSLVTVAKDELLKIQDLLTPLSQQPEKAMEPVCRVAECMKEMMATAGDHRPAPRATWGRQPRKLRGSPPGITLSQARGIRLRTLEGATHR